MGKLIPIAPPALPSLSNKSEISEQHPVGGRNRREAGLAWAVPTDSRPCLLGMEYRSPPPGCQRLLAQQYPNSQHTAQIVL